MLLHETDRDRIVGKIAAAIDAANIAEYEDGHRSHLGASLMGEKCNRYLWYTWRWVAKETFRDTKNQARMQRLFNRGHLEELRLVDWLKKAGLTVWEVDPQTGNQFRISDFGGHFGGSCDGIARLPEALGYPDNILLEFKTHNTKSFTALLNDGVKKARPKHYAQMCQYGARLNLKYGLYMAINKNDDDIHLELVELDHGYGEELIKRAGYIITAKEPPARLHETSTHIDCKFCSMAEVCHNGAPYERNCRSCTYAYPGENKTWACGKFNQTIPADFIPKGCDQWHPVGRK